ncbi:pseudouridine synthase pus4 [Kickxella alabastrina]|uniref:Pseudouridine synthase pus4 n=1 Tax=Kickxella alabastrina TaxID=61397 RepID=A0ACC1IIW5_9FUNG|nr:pseudouridine synthase pus4 [Kickxella alabastrina]
MIAVAATAAVTSVLEAASRKTSTQLQTLNGIFAVNKPPGISCTGLLDYIKRNAGKGVHAMPFAEHFERERQLRVTGKKIRRPRCSPHLRVGHGGTLDVEAGGVLVVGLGNGCKQLEGFLKGGKSYLAEARLGIATESFDAEGRVTEIVDTSVSADDIRRQLGQFTGNIMQIPPKYSAIRIDGKRLYEYARDGTTVPVPVEARPVHIGSIDLLHFQAPGQATFGVRARLPPDVETYYAEGRYRWEGGRARQGEPLLAWSNEPGVPRMQMLIQSGGGVYIRSLIHDLGYALGSAATMMTLLRLSQGPLRLDKDSIEIADLPYDEKIIDAVRHSQSLM